MICRERKFVIKDFWVIVSKNQRDDMRRGYLGRGIKRRVVMLVGVIDWVKCGLKIV